MSVTLFDRGPRKDAVVTSAQPPTRQVRGSAMQPIRSVRYVVLVAGLLAASALAPTHQADAAEQWGEVHFPVSCQASVQPTFDQAVAMLHSFAFGDAAKTFSAVAHDDPDCAMAYWGLATTAMGSLIAGRAGPVTLQKGWDLVRQAKGG